MTKIYARRGVASLTKSQKTKSKKCTKEKGREKQRALRVAKKNRNFRSPENEEESYHASNNGGSGSLSQCRGGEQASDSGHRYNQHVRGSRQKFIH